MRLPPNIDLNGPIVVVLRIGQTYVEQGAVANDAVDGMLWSNVTYYTLGMSVVQQYGLHIISIANGQPNFCGKA